MSTREHYTKGARVWIPDSEEVWRAAELLEDYTGQKKVSVQYEDAEKSTISVADESKLPHLRNPEILIGENDLTSLSYLNEPEVLYNLKVRFINSNIIYTYCGIVLVAINPYEQLDIYSHDIIQAYSGQDMGSMDPHVFAVAEEAFKQMSRFERNQSIIVSGESGAGKTVSAKYAMRYFASVGGSQAETQVEKRVLASNPIMEAIGNAKTIRNDNSSRFGKYIQINFNKYHQIISADMRTYLLEKSRVVFQAPDERNYHIFYQLCASAALPEFKDYKLAHQDNFLYTNQGESPDVREVDDAEELANTREAFTLLGLPDKQQMMVFRVFAAILHFGNVRIEELEGEVCQVKPKDIHLSHSCRLLGIDESQMRMWLCNRKILTVNEILVKPLNYSQTLFAKDALSKRIYAKMFDWIVTELNKSLHSSQKEHRFIGVLDIYGFETFEVNSFEQFCINYANEKLQQQFNMHVFKLEQEEYVKEEIEWSFIDFYDNQPCIDLIETKLGILDLLDEECKIPNGSDGNWCQKLFGKHLKTSAHFEKPRMSNVAFIIIHFADKVEYQAEGFLEKNRDTVNDEHINILKASEIALVAELFMETAPVAKARTSSRGHTVTPMKKAVQGAKKDHRKTVASQFRESLNMLMQTLNVTTPHYIRCVKPNDEKLPFTFDPMRAVEQLRACGVLETIRISAAGYPSRWTYLEFYQRYRVLAHSKEIDRKNQKKTSETILNKLIQDPDKYRFGKTKIFFRAGQVALMEKLRSERLRACVIMMQKHVRGWLQKRKYLKIRRTVLFVQRMGRGLLARRHAQHLRESHSATTIQKSWRAFIQRRKYRKIREATIHIQALTRALIARRKYVNVKRQMKAIVIQSCIRGWLMRRRRRIIVRGITKLQGYVRIRRAKKELKKLKIEARSVAHIKHVNIGLENKIIELQQRLDSRKKEITTLREQEISYNDLKNEVERLRSSSVTAKQTSNKVVSLEEEVERLREELEKEKEEKADIMKEKEKMRVEHEKTVIVLIDERSSLKDGLDKANQKIQDQENALEENAKASADAANQLLVTERDAERSHHQKLVNEHARLQQRMENLQGQVVLLTSPEGQAYGHSRTPSNLSAISLESVSADSISGAVWYDDSVAPAEVNAVKNEDMQNERDDQGYHTGKRVKRPDNLGDGVTNEKQAKKRQAPQPPKAAAAAEMTAGDVALLLKQQNRIKELEKVTWKLKEELDQRSEPSTPSGKSLSLATDSPYSTLKMQELENKNDKLKREVDSLMKAIAQTTDFDGGVEMSSAGKEFLDQFEAMADELERRREECLQLRSMLAESSITSQAIAEESYGGMGTLVNEDNELAMAYKTQKDLNRLLQNQLDKAERDYKTREEELTREIGDLRKDNKRQNKLIGQSLTMTPDAKIEATMQHEITRLTSENFDLREMLDRQMEQIRKLKKMLKVYAKKLKDGEAAEIAAELEREEQAGMGIAPKPKRERQYMGMLEYKKEDEAMLVKNLVINLKPAVANKFIPGLPAYLMFMCVRHIDYTNDEEKIRTLLTSIITSIKKVIKKYHDDIDRITLWLANTCRFLHNLKQYSGEKPFQADNSTRQNEQCLRNFDLSDYRQVFSDFAVFIYTELTKVMKDTIQPVIVPAVLEHEAIAGLTASKPSGMRGRASSHARDLETSSRDLSLETLMRHLNQFHRALISHAVDPELIKQIFRDLFYFVCAGALNNLLLRKDMCNWSTGMQIRYNLSHLEQWLRDKKLQDSGALGTLEPIIQASQLLQARKTDADVDSIVEMCGKLTVAQIVKILNLYTPIDDFEEKVPMSFIRKIQEKLKSRHEQKSALLIDSKYSFAVTFPYTSSAIAIETIEVPEVLQLSFLTRS